MSGSDPKPGPKPGPWPPAPESSPMPPSTWAKRTGFRPKFSGETTAVTDSGQVSLPVRAKQQQETQPDLEAGQARPRPSPPPVSAVAANGVIDKDKKEKEKEKEKEKPIPTPPPPPPRGATRRRDSDGGVGRSNGPDGANGSGDPVRRPARTQETVEVLPQSVDDDLVARSLHMKYGLRDTPGLVPIGFYGVQHYLSMLGSLILVPLVIVPAMGGSHEDTANVVSTVLFVCGITTLLHTSFGSRLPLIQGPSFVFLAPALAIINSPEFQGLDGNVLINGLQLFVPTNVKPKLQIVDTFIKAYYLPETEYVHWARAHPEFTKAQVVGLVNLVATMKGWKRKTRLEIVEKIESA